jgi:transposase
MLKPGIDIKKIIVLTGRTDLRRGIDGLVSIVKLRYGLNPVEIGALFLFCGTKKDRIKGIFFEGDGFVLVLKRLSQGKYRWPHNEEEAKQLNFLQFSQLMDGFTIESSINRISKKDPET